MPNEYENRVVEIGSKILKDFSKKANKGNAPAAAEINKIIKEIKKK